MEWNSDAARRLWEIAETAGDGELGSELRKMAVEVEGEVESAWADGTDAYFDMVAEENGWAERREGEEVEEYVKRCFLPVPRCADGCAWEPVRTCRDFGGEEGTNGEGYDFACSACGWCGDIADPYYCPNCGAKVVG